MNATPEPEFAPVLPNTIACTFTAVPHSWGCCIFDDKRWRDRSSTNRTRRRSTPSELIPRIARELFAGPLLHQLLETRDQLLRVDRRSALVSSMSS